MQLQTTTLDLIRWLRTANKNRNICLLHGTYHLVGDDHSRVLTDAELACMYISRKRANGSQLEKATALLSQMASVWCVDLEYLKKRTKADDRPMMRFVFWFIAKQRFQNVSYMNLALITGMSDHSAVRRAFKKMEGWLHVKDPLFMKYYAPVAHLVEAETLETQE